MCKNRGVTEFLSEAALHPLWLEAVKPWSANLSRFMNLSGKVQGTGLFCVWKLKRPKGKVQVATVNTKTRLTAHPSVVLRTCQTITSPRYNLICEFGTCSTPTKECEQDSFHLFLNLIQPASQLTRQIHQTLQSTFINQISMRTWTDAINYSAAHPAAQKPFCLSGPKYFVCTRQVNGKRGAAITPPY